VNSTDDWGLLTAANIPADSGIYSGYNSSGAAIVSSDSQIIKEKGIYSDLQDHL